MTTRTKKTSVILIFILFLSCPGFSQDKTEVAKPASDPVVPQFKEGNKVYLSIGGTVPRMVIYQSPVGKDEYNNKGFSKDDGYPDNLIPYDDKIDVRIWTRSGTNREVLRINAKTLLDSLAEEIKKNPTEKKKWQYKQSAEEYSVNFQFAGIQRIFRLHSITVPISSDLQKREEYKGGTPPKLHLFIDINGVLKKDIPTSRKGWNMTFPQDVSSQFELREWTDEAIALRLKDRNTWTTRRQLMEFPTFNITDIQCGTVREKLNRFDGGKDAAVTLEFREVTE